MSQYKKVMQTKGIQQKEVLDAVHRVDARVDKPLLSKIVNDVCLPTPATIQSYLRYARLCTVGHLRPARSCVYADIGGNYARHKCAYGKNPQASTKYRRLQFDG